MAQSKKVCGIDLFAGAGGLSLGAQMAGVTITHAIENNPAAAATYKINHSETQLLEASIRMLSPIQKSKGALNILFGGPPCQGFSTSNQKTRTISNPRNWLFGEVFRFARYSKPDWVVLENVKGLRETAQGRFEEMILNELEDLGYKSTVWSLCASNYGVPQKRHRLFFIGRLKGNLPPQPAPTYSIAITVRQAIADLPILSSGSSLDTLAYRNVKPSEYALLMRAGAKSCTGNLVTLNNRLVLERYNHIPEGGNWNNIPKRLMKNYSNLLDDRSRHSGIYRRLKWNEPSAVIANYRKNMLIHPGQNRGLSVREAARLQSFPDCYRFSGSIGQQQQQVGNAVPPLLAKAVFETIINAD
jgi:DNA (cytosine-5)-methyltransferase 1